MDKTSANPTPAFKPPLSKNDIFQPSKNNFSYRSVIRSLNFLTNSSRPEAQFAVHKYIRIKHKPKYSSQSSRQTSNKIPQGNCWARTNYES